MLKSLATMTTATPREAKHYGTIVLGAGMAGVSCAARLYEQPRFQDKQSLLVLEARDRIGGRVGSVYVNGNRLDTGANWIHGIGTNDASNPLVQILPHKRYRELSSRVAFRAPVAGDNNHRQDVVTSEGSGDWVKVERNNMGSDFSQEQETQRSDLVIPSDIAATLNGALWGMIGSLHELATSTDATEAKKTTILQAIHKTGALRDARKEIPSDLHRSLGAIPQFIENMEAAPLVAQSAEHSEDQLGMSLLEYAIDDFDGEQVFLQDGYTAVIDEVAKHLIDADVVKLNTEVKHVDWSEKPIVVKTTSGTYLADRVVCTLPLGVLQKHHQRSRSSSLEPALFRPELPRDMRQAITSLGFGTLDKIFLVYKHPWWTEEPFRSIFKKGFSGESRMSGTEESNPESDGSVAPDSFTGFTDELAGIEIHEDGSTSSGIRLLSVINLQNLTGFPVLSVFVSCANATHIESLRDDQAGALLHRALTSWLAREPPKPDAVHVTRWAQDQYSRGSYSHMITGVSETGHREIFQQPLVNKQGAELRFAGEHTSRDHFATVHGALISGWREADDILQRIGKDAQ